MPRPEAKTFETRTVYTRVPADYQERLAALAELWSARTGSRVSAADIVQECVLAHLPLLEVQQGVFK